VPLTLYLGNRACSSMDTVARAAAYVNKGINSLNLVDTALLVIDYSVPCFSFVMFHREKPHVLRRAREDGAILSKPIVTISAEYGYLPDIAEIESP
jgi:hypothetical protein